ncbi:unnamed protein product [Didymodactylos carnosus]|uniref:Uncharacterized protein n=1 Tax=Didymodactylos carnosus TaxID=1234261 RepID=A0A8S2EJ87_9BILA|nr:unnamed protein product [Didymodactylos carnosus]CAF3974223.1 unnamed protein product [Didymodactylos carnosus]
MKKPTITSPITIQARSTPTLSSPLINRLNSDNDENDYTSKSLTKLLLPKTIDGKQTILTRHVESDRKRRNDLTTTTNNKKIMRCSNTSRTKTHDEENNEEEHKQDVDNEISEREGINDNGLSFDRELYNDLNHVIQAERTP